MLHARVIHPPALGATLISVDESSIASIKGARVVRIQSFLAVVAEREWNAIRAARALQAKWPPGTGLPDYTREFESMRASRIVRDQEIAKRGDLSALNAAARRHPAPQRVLSLAHPDARLHRPLVRGGRRARRLHHGVELVAEHPRLPVHLRAHARRRARPRPRDLPGRLGLLPPERRRRRRGRGGPALQGHGRPGARAVDVAGGARA